MKILRGGLQKFLDTRKGGSEKIRGASENLYTLRWPNTVFARALADAIQHVQKDYKNKHVVHTAIILFAQCPLYLCYFSS